MNLIEAIEIAQREGVPIPHIPDDPDLMIEIIEHRLNAQSSEKRHGDGSHDDSSHGNWANGKTKTPAIKYPLRPPVEQLITGAYSKTISRHNSYIRSLSYSDVQVLEWWSDGDYSSVQSYFRNVDPNNAGFDSYDDEFEDYYGNPEEGLSVKEVAEKLDRVVRNKPGRDKMTSWRYLFGRDVDEPFEQAFQSGEPLTFHGMAASTLDWNVAKGRAEDAAKHGSVILEMHGVTGLYMGDVSQYVGTPEYELLYPNNTQWQVTEKLDAEGQTVWVVREIA